MKVVQITVDEGLLREIDALPEVRESGRSAFLRRLAAAHLRDLRQREIRDAYRRGYGEHPVRDGEFATDPERLAWPED